jgi:hypothetical protein
MKRFSYRVPFLMLLGMIFSCLHSFGDDKEKFGFYIPRAKEELYGTWTNTITYTGGVQYSQKIVMYDWGYYETYSKVTDEFSRKNGTYIIVDRWTDSEENIWYKEYIRGRNELYPIFELDKISKGGTVWEYVIGYDDFPTADNMNSKNPYYRIYYREQDAF